MINTSFRLIETGHCLGCRKTIRFYHSVIETKDEFRFHERCWLVWCRALKINIDILQAKRREEESGG